MLRYYWEEAERASQLQMLSGGGDELSEEMDRYARAVCELSEEIDRLNELRRNAQATSLTAI